VGCLHQWVLNNIFQVIIVSISVSPKLLKRISHHKQNHMALLPCFIINLYKRATIRQISYSLGIVLAYVVGLGQHTLLGIFVGWGEHVCVGGRGGAQVTNLTEYCWFVCLGQHFIGYCCWFMWGLGQHTLLCIVLVYEGPRTSHFTGYYWGLCEVLGNTLYWASALGLMWAAFINGFKILFFF
jgi:hypothetical protein